MNTNNKIKTLLEKLGGKINVDISLAFVKIFYSRGKRKTNKRMYIRININGRIIFGKFPLSKNDKKVIKEADILEKIFISQFSIPEVILRVDNGFFMSAVGENPIEIILKKQGLSKSIKILEEAVRRIANFHQITKIRHTSLKEKLNIYSKLTDISSVDIHQKDLFKKVSMGYTHGDLDPFNMFFDTKTNDYGLIDWEDFSEKGFQELDILHFLIMTAVILYPRGKLVSLYKKIFLKHTFLSKVIMKLLYEYCRLRKKDINVIINLLPVYCDFQIQRLIKASRNPKDFLYQTFKKLFREKYYKIYL